MGTIAEMYDNWCLEELRWDTQVNKKVWLAWFNKWLLTFQKMILEYVSGKQSSSVAYTNIEADKDEYALPVFDWIEHIEDFYSIIQLRVAYHSTKAGNPVYRVCKPIDFSEYNLAPALNTYKKHVLINPSGEYKASNWAKDEKGNYLYEYVNEQEFDADDKPLYKLVERGGTQRGEPIIWGRVSEAFPRYIFVPSVNSDGVYTSHIKIFPTPLKDVARGLTLTYNFMQQPVKYSDAFPNNISNSMELSKLNLPWYFLDAIDDYITFRLYQAENPEMAQWYYQQFENTLHDNIYGLNKDKRPIDEGFANTTYFSHY